jgi:hypothetical protein
MTVQIDLSQYDHIERARYYLQVGRLWEHVRKHFGDDVTQEIVSFLFREDFLEERQRMFPSLGEFPLVPGKALNAVRMTNENILAFPPFPAPDIPANMQVSLTVIE